MHEDELQDQLNKVPQWIRAFYGAYFAELRTQFAVDPEALRCTY